MALRKLGDIFIIVDLTGNDLGKVQFNPFRVSLEFS
jgi:hypothetical protein